MTVTDIETPVDVTPDAPTKTTTLRVLVTGSRDWSDWNMIRNTLLALNDNEAYVDYMLYHGAARGADTMTAYTVEHDGEVKDEATPNRDNRFVHWSVRAFPAEWDLFGKRAGFLRNEQMVNTILADADRRDGTVDNVVCVAFIQNHSRGATMCADLAEKAGIKTIRLESAKVNPVETTSEPQADRPW